MNREILIINNNLDTGGVEIILQNLTKVFDERGYKITLWASNGSRKVVRERFPDSVAFRKYPFWNVNCKRFSPKWFFSRISRVMFEKLILRLKKWPLVVAFKEGEDMVLASKLRARRKVAWVHTDYGAFHWTGYCFANDEAERLCMAGFDAVAVVSEAAGRGLVQAIGDPGNLQVVYNPIDYDHIEKRARAHCPQRPKDKAVLVCVGRLSAVKRHSMLIDICNELSEQFPLELWIVGGGELEEELQRKLVDENIHCVKLLGQQRNPYPYIACADWLVSASETESYGLTVQEALVLGVPVIACRCPAIEENMSEDFGILAGMDKEQLKEAICRALSEKELHTGYARSIAEGYDKSRLWEERLEKMYKFIVGEESST